LKVKKNKNGKLVKQNDVVAEKGPGQISFGTNGERCLREKQHKENISGRKKKTRGDAW